MAAPYGSQQHLLRYLGYHREELNRRIAAVLGAQKVEWLDFPFNVALPRLDDEWKGVAFLDESHAEVCKKWVTWWPQSGNVQNWDAIDKVHTGQTEEWLLVEAKAHLREMQSSCGAIGRGLEMVRSALSETQRSMGADVPIEDWLAPYYQYANRLAALYFLNANGIPARLLYIYFLGDKHLNMECPTEPMQWEVAITDVHQRLGLPGSTESEQRWHSVMLPVCL